MAVTYYALLTTIGAGKLANATALGTTLKITQLAVGDGGGNVPTPDASRTQLVNEVRRAPLNRLSVDPANSAQIIAEQVIPEDVGGWWIREMGLYDEAGALIAYANCAPSYKPQLAEGSGRTQTVRIVLIVSNAASVELKIDPSVVLATREYVDNSIVTALNRLDYKQSVRAATTASITLSGLQTVDGVALAAGDRVLVKNQSYSVDNGLYVVASGAWKRTTDADDSSEVTPGLTVAVESGTSLADSVWQLVTDSQIVLGTTPLQFQNITNGLAKLASPTFSGVPSAPTAAQGTNNQQLATTAFVQATITPLAPKDSPVFVGVPSAQTPPRFDSSQRLATTEFVRQAIGNCSGFIAVSANTTLTPAQVGFFVASNVGTGAVSLALPLISNVPIGSTFTVTHASGAMSSFGLVTSGSDILIAEGLGGNISPYAMAFDETITVVSTGASWKITSGNGVRFLKAGRAFDASLASSGYQRLPSGLLIQWGVNATAIGAASGNFSFTIPFPSACLQIVASDSGNSCIPVGASAISNSQFIVYRAGKVYTSAGDLVVPPVVTFRWFAFGI
ncbi:phage tail protein [Pseudomonas sp. LABIM340]|uniref:phage tail protein n=1 Tax=Pseudomonas sp. LABIM340 TaxID=3156585 RepID=UPI0032AEED9B